MQGVPGPHPEPGSEALTLSQGGPAMIMHIAAPTVGVWAGPPEDPARYEVFEELGTGAEGTTYRAHYVAEPGAAPVTVALKMYRPPAGASPAWPHEGTWRQITQQRALLAGLPSSQHLVNTRDAFLGSLTWQGSDPRTVPVAAAATPFVVMEWIAGWSPETLLQRGAISLSTRLRWISELVEAVRLLHSLSVQDGNALVHGDIKPSNCVIAQTGRLVLLDLGAAVHVESRSSHRGLHTPAYAAPEVLVAPRARRTPASDLYALGLTAVALLGAGEVAPSKGKQRSAAALARLDQVLLRAPRRTRARVRALVGDLLAEDPAARRSAPPTAWSQEAEILRTRTRRRLTRAGTVMTAAAAALTLTALTTHTGPFRGAVDSKSHTIRWDRLSQVAHPSDQAVSMAASFPQDAGAWTETASDLSAVGVTDAGLEMHAGTHALPTLLTAPGLTGGSREVLTASTAGSSAAHASTTGGVTGQGMWGIWCRGTGDGSPQRYRFLLSHAGAAAISELGQDANGVVAEASTGWWWLKGLPTSGPTTIEGRCLDDDEGVLLEMIVDGRQVLTYRPQIAMLGPGASGLEAETFDDVKGAALTANITAFSAFGDST